jgi:hypothetical protein
MTKLEKAMMAAVKKGDILKAQQIMEKINKSIERAAAKAKKPAPKKKQSSTKQQIIKQEARVQEKIQKDFVKKERAKVLKSKGKSPGRPKKTVAPKPVEEIQPEPEVAQTPKKTTKKFSDPSFMAPSRDVNKKRGGKNYAEPTPMVNKNRDIKFIDSSASLFTNKDKQNFKKDGEIDKKLWGDNEPGERRDPVKKISVVCRVCRKKYMVFPSQIPPNLEGESIGYVCLTCVPSSDSSALGEDDE